MLRDKYTFTHTRTGAAAIFENYQTNLPKHQTALHFLCALTLKRFMQKLLNHSNTHGKKPAKISLNREEALAFHLAYHNSYLDSSCSFTSEIFIEIDRSFNKTPEQLLNETK